MMIVGQISTPEEAKEIEFIAKSLVIGNRARVLARKITLKEVIHWIKMTLKFGFGFKITNYSKQFVTHLRKV